MVTLIAPPAIRPTKRKVTVESGLVRVETAICCALVEVVLFESVTVSVTLYEPALEYVSVTLAPVLDDPSPKFQL